MLGSCMLASSCMLRDHACWSCMQWELGRAEGSCMHKCDSAQADVHAYLFSHPFFQMHAVVS